jgi:cytochrome c biogenesis protein CcdA/thiol-disulfide isomerase/thioredoxin
MFLLLGAFIAGILTVIAPCVLPLLPVIIGGSVSGDTKDKRRPLLIAGSLAVSLIIFTLLLKATTLLINIPPQAITYFSGGIIVALGIVTLFPNLYVQVISRLGIEHRALRLLSKGTGNRSQIIGPILTGTALGPVFSSCSPVYAYILATVLPAHFAQAMAYVVSYVVGLSLILLAIGVYGQKLTARIRFASNPNGIFQRGLAVLFIVVGVLIITGAGVKLQTFAAAHTPFDFDSFSAKLLPTTGKKINNSQLYNVAAYKAPELTGIQGWINSNPLTLQQLKGKVVLLDFWTYTCINCIRTLPYTQGWYTQYQKDGLVVIGIEAPEFSFEKVRSNVAAAVKKDGLTYPIALDSNLDTWNAYQNQYWPAEYLINRSGQVVRQDFGEGNYAQSEQAIRGLLAQGNTDKLSSHLVASTPASSPVANGQTPETYLGAEREDSYVGTADQETTSSANFHYASNLSVDAWSLSGGWNVADQYITALSNSKLKLHFAAKNVYLVAGSKTPVQVGITLNGQPITAAQAVGTDVVNSQIMIGQSTIYHLISQPSFADGTIELSVPAGANLNVFTFGN